jgi:shikimate kinase
VLHREATCVIATGGGVVKRAANLSLIAESAVTVYLHATPRDLAVRLRNDVRRPLLQGGDRLEKIEQLFRERHLLYREMAQVQVDAVGRPLSVLLRDIMESLDRALPGGAVMASTATPPAPG